MRIAVAGTHASGKSTLVADFLAAHREYEHEPEPYEWLDEDLEAPDAGSFFRQLQLAVRSSGEHGPGERAIAERSPLDFLAYLMALDELDRGGRSADLTARAEPLAAAGMRCIDLLVVLPLGSGSDRIDVDGSEDPALREAMNDVLLELVHDTGLVGEHAAVVEISGTPVQRLAALEAALAASVAPDDVRRG
ncbi:AAA family ATPase [Agromyces mariniharenae]|uniref:AAA family ATPase n=1 Tax=Agromyces mariniharenae TaxID=2604423 RepID=A0A5S4V667_9MICO|nr:AAA family ATPase [Agromyces mariniharenae]TYL53529.1 AAA family ATPase [Agromyces mariniharenae]